MKTITTKNIDGLDIITNIGNVDGLIDPEATKKIVKVEILKTDVHKNVEKIKKQMSVYGRQAYEAMKHAKKAKTEADKNKFTAEYNGRSLQFKEEQEKLKPLAVEMSAIYKSMMVEHAEYFHPKQGEEIVEDADANRIEQKMIAATASGKLLDRDEKEIHNYVGRVFWQKVQDKWEKWECHSLGIAPFAGSKEMKDLTESEISEISEQIEIDRIAGLKSVNKAAEKASILSGLLTRSAVMKTELDILADSKSLTKAQAWLADETVKVEAKYD